MSLINWEKNVENRVKDLNYNKSGRYGIIYQWRHNHEEFYVTVKRTSDGTYEILKGSSKIPSRESPIKEDFLHSNYEDAEKKAREWMRNNPEPEQVERTI